MEQYKVLLDNYAYDIQLTSKKDFIINGEEIHHQLLSTKSGLLQLKIDNNYFKVYCKEISETDFEIWIQHYVFKVKLEDTRSRLLSQLKKITQLTTNIVYVKAPMPGLVKAVEVKQGDIVEKGGGLIILEAMKMENEIKSNIKGKIKSVEVKTNNSVEKDQTLLTIEPLRED